MHRAYRAESGRLQLPRGNNKRNQHMLADPSCGCGRVHQLVQDALDQPRWLLQAVLPVLAMPGLP